MATDNHTPDLSHRLAYKDPKWDNDVSVYDLLLMPLDNAITLLLSIHEDLDEIGHMAMAEVRDAKAILEAWLAAKRDITETAADIAQDTAEVLAKQRNRSGRNVIQPDEEVDDDDLPTVFAILNPIESELRNVLDELDENAVDEDAVAKAVSHIRKAIDALSASDSEVVEDEDRRRAGDMVFGLMAITATANTLDSGCDDLESEQIAGLSRLIAREAYRLQELFEHFDPTAGQNEGAA
jgi:hypothetical protein